MTRYLALAELSRRELENLLLAEHGALSRILRTVRDHTEPQWKVRREVERIVDEAVDRRPFVVAYVRASEIDSARVRTVRNAARWDRWRESGH
ncbi:MAG: hypothetical protein ACREEC_01155 [Thermoplasmata archaeon]